MNNKEWTVVRRKKRGIQKARASKKAMPHGVRVRGDIISERDEGEPSAEEEGSGVRARLKELSKSFEASAWWKGASQRLRDGVCGRQVVAFHCLGIGSFTNFLDSCYQLACALLIKDCFARNAKCTIADPAMGPVDNEIARDSFEIVETTSVDSTAVVRPHIVEVSKPGHGECVIWFMPHCPKELYECVLEKCAKFGYEGMVFFGNKFSYYCHDVWSWCDQRPVRDERCPCLEGLCEGEGGTLEERDCPDAKISPSEGAFNDLSVVTIVKRVEIGIVSVTAEGE